MSASPIDTKIWVTMTSKLSAMAAASVCAGLIAAPAIGKKKPKPAPPTCAGTTWVFCYDSPDEIGSPSSPFPDRGAQLTTADAGQGRLTLKGSFAPGGGDVVRVWMFPVPPVDGPYRGTAMASGSTKAKGGKVKASWVLAFGYIGADGQPSFCNNKFDSRPVSKKGNSLTATCSPTAGVQYGLVLAAYLSATKQVKSFEAKFAASMAGMSAG